ncbi:leucine-rich repeat-containing protein 46 [Rana temporaria]|uniref:leucine-rich repeat-containing protein 46 n=1 Tax=Rana temporaria TaxID=8407 RepID=UPI001AAD0F63|nr:leucine-rich repeat-containing protein 46 [Rana temporaria]
MPAGRRGKEDTPPILAAILRRNVSTPLHGATQEDVSSALQSLQTVRLDREGITKLTNLEAVDKAHSLYLQENQIKTIENVGVLQNMQFLNLSGNRIEKIQNLRSLQNLQVLDLSNNLIQKLNAGELPQKLLILDVSGNPCTKTKGYRQQVLDALPLLQELDGVTVRAPSSQKSGSEEEKDGSDNDEPSLLSEDSDSLSSLTQDMLQRSHQRRQRALREHEDRLAELNENRDGQSFFSHQQLCSAELPGTSHLNIDSQDKTSLQTKNTGKPNKDHRDVSLLEKNTKDLPKVGKVVSKKQTAASASTEKRTNLIKTAPASNTQTTFEKTSRRSAEITRGTTSCNLKERQTTQKITRHTSEKTTAPGRSAMSAPNQKRAVSSKRL